MSLGLMMAPLLSVGAGGAGGSKAVGSLLGLGINVWYFARRWKYIGDDTLSADETPLESETEVSE